MGKRRWGLAAAVAASPYYYIVNPHMYIAIVMLDCFISPYNLADISYCENAYSK